MSTNKNTFAECKKGSQDFCVVEMSHSGLLFPRIVLTVNAPVGGNEVNGPTPVTHPLHKVRNIGLRNEVPRIVLQEIPLLPTRENELVFIDHLTHIVPLMVRIQCRPHPLPLQGHNHKHTYLFNHHSYLVNLHRNRTRMWCGSTSIRSRHLIHV